MSKLKNQTVNLIFYQFAQSHIELNIYNKNSVNTTIIFVPTIFSYVRDLRNVFVDLWTTKLLYVF